MKNAGSFSLEEFPSSRIATIDIGNASQMKHYIKALIEIDVTKARNIIREKKKSNENISFNSWLIKCISLVVDEFGDIHAIRKSKRKKIIFEDIDISIMVEREIKGKKVPLPYVIRKTNNKSISEIDIEIKSAMKQSIKDEGNNVLGGRKNKHLMKLYYSMPGFIRKGIWKRIINNPFMTKQNMGTVMITSVGMMGSINGWVIPFGIHPLSIAVSSIIRKPGVVEDSIEIREYLPLTISVDHDVIDGAPAIRALSKLNDLLANGHGL